MTNPAKPDRRAVYSDRIRVYCEGTIWLVPLEDDGDNAHRPESAVLKPKGLFSEE